MTPSGDTSRVAMAADGAAPRRASSLALVFGPVVAIVLVSLALSVVLVTRHVSQIRAGLIDRARTVAQFMTRDAGLGVLRGDHASLHHLASLAAMQDDVVYASVHDARGQAMAHRGEMPPPAATLVPRRTGGAAGLDLFTSAAGWEVRAPLRADADEVGHIRLGISHERLDRERRMAVATAVAFTTFVTLLASVGAAIFMRHHLATLLAAAALAEEHERVADLKAGILTQASHEFRTPLAVIMSASDVLQRYGERLTAEERGARVQKIRGAVHHMTDLLDDVLMFDRADASRFAPVATDLVPLCRRALEHARTLAPATLQLTAVLPPATLEAAVDPFLLGQALRVLLANAIRRSPDGGTVTFALAASETEVRVTVTDGSTGNAATIPGSGLGLATAERAVAAHGGHIEARSTAGSGSTLTITLPAACPSAPGRSAAA